MNENKLINLHKEKDILLRRVCLVMRNISDFHLTSESGDMATDDCDVWDSVIRHSSIQSRLNAVIKDCRRKEIAKRMISEKEL